ncbi:Poly [ADP-ribose] polymerase tankyrase-2 [Sparganum proliferum]
MLLCRVALGRSFIQFNAMKVAHAPPGHHSVVGRPSAGGLNFAEYVVYRGEQAYPEYRITYLLVPPDPTSNTTSAGDSTSAPPPLTSSVSRPNAAPPQTSNLLPSAAFSCPTAGSSTTNVSVNARGGAPTFCGRPAPGGPGGNP